VAKTKTDRVAVYGVECSSGADRGIQALFLHRPHAAEFARTHVETSDCRTVVVRKKWMTLEEVGNLLEPMMKDLMFLVHKRF
jgi:hypothetical protein